MILHFRSDCDLCRRYAPNPPTHDRPRFGHRRGDEADGLTIDELLAETDELLREGEK